MMDRAYSVLTIKSVDADRRVITGIATTPTPDRHGDIIEPLGVTFNESRSRSYSTTIRRSPSAR